LPISSALPIPTLPAVSKPTLFRQRIPLMNFPAWPGQSGVQPMFVEQYALLIFPDEPVLPIFPTGGHCCHHPNV
jgi:hypothetical protein